MSLFDSSTPSEPQTVSAITKAIKNHLERGFSSVCVTGELSNVARPSSGHVYFSLKDPKAILRAVIFRTAAAKVRFDLQDGIEVVVRGTISVYELRGEYQLYAEEIIPKGVGTLELAFRQLKEKLAAKGYFDEARKRPLPAFPRSLAIVTSPTGAAIRDMLELLARRWPVAKVLVIPVKVQGDGSAQEIARAIQTVNHLHRKGEISIDAVIVGRGGGSLEDLWSFNEEIVADAIVSSTLPIISAVGHEIDVTIADLVADHRALTPSHAITDLTPDRESYLQALNQYLDRLKTLLKRRLELAKERLEYVLDRRVFRMPLESIRDWERHLDDTANRMRKATQSRIANSKQQLALMASRLESLSPLQVLGRGYSLTFTEIGLPVKDASTLAVGQILRTKVSLGQIMSRVESVQTPEIESR